MVTNPKYAPCRGYVERDIGGERVMQALSSGAASMPMTSSSGSDDIYEEIAKVMSEAVNEV